MRVWPHDLDLNFHLNNGRFLSLMDLGRTRLGIKTGLFKKSLEKKWGFGVVGGMSITYLKSLAPFQKFKLTSKLAGYHDGWFFIEQRFESREKLVAAALVKVAFLRSGKKVMPEEIMNEMGVDHIGENKEYLENIFNSEKEFLQFIKKDY
jgi:acyl-CoA thioesterase FadM